MSKKKYHVEIIYESEHKSKERINGDAVVQYKTNNETIFIIADGIGSGIKANISANLITSQMIKMLEVGFSLHEAINNIVRNLHKARTKDVPFAAFTVIKVLNNFYTSIYSYESPSPIFIEKGYAFIPEPKYHHIHNETIEEREIKLTPDRQILIITDGVSQAGMGFGKPKGWTVEGVKSFINNYLNSSVEIHKLPIEILNKTKEISGFVLYDDTTISLIRLKSAKIINILTGPPRNKEDDNSYIKDFLQEDGLKIICGSTTVEIYSRESGKEIKNISLSSAYSKPPRYYIDGVDIATEGAVVLNQVTNIIDEDVEKYDPDSAVSEIAILLNAADIINFKVGKAVNKGHSEILFKQMGLLSRSLVLKKLIKKLKNKGKLVNVTYY